MANSLAFNRDCMEAMREFPDKFFDLAVVDPPYGDGLERERERELEPVRTAIRPVQDSGSITCRGAAEREREREREREKRRTHVTSGVRGGKRPPDWWNLGGEVRKKIIEWDTAPDQAYFDELFRVSRSQIIWGGNYFRMPPTRCFLIWRKTNVPLEGFSMAPAEYAWTSFNENARVFEFSAINQPGRFHPTQKPVELYRWIFQHFAHEGDIILDTHLGSGSSRIAAYDAGLDFWGYEIDETYFRLEEERFEAHSAQLSLFLDEPQEEITLDT